MNLWQKLTIDWPCVLGDWLWLYVVVATKEFVRRLTPRLILRAAAQIALFAVLLAFLQYVLMFDLTFLFFIDVATIPDIVVGLFAVVAAGFAGRALAAAARGVKPLLKSYMKVWSRFGARQRRNAIALRRKTGEQSDDEPAAWAGAALTAAA